MRRVAVVHRYAALLPQVRVFELEKLEDAETRAVMGFAGISRA
jgi:hypothetical protein